MNNSHNFVRDGVVSFAQSPEGGPIKIGCSANVARRLKEHHYYHGPLVLLGSVPGNTLTERAMHQKFAAYRLYNDWGNHLTEWFEPAPEILSFIGAAAAGPLSFRGAGEGGVEPAGEGGGR